MSAIISSIQSVKLTKKDQAQKLYEMVFDIGLDEKISSIVLLPKYQADIMKKKIGKSIEGGCCGQNRCFACLTGGLTLESIKEYKKTEINKKKKINTTKIWLQIPLQQ